MTPLWRYYVYAYRQFFWIFEKEFDSMHEALIFMEDNIDKNPLHRYSMEIVRDGKSPMGIEVAARLLKCPDCGYDFKIMEKLGEEKENEK